MSFADELRQKQQSIIQISDEEIYQKCLSELYDELKNVIRYKASEKISNVISGEYILGRNSGLPINPAVLEHRETAIHRVIKDNDGDYFVTFQDFSETTLKSGIISSSVKISLTEAGKRVTQDLIQLAQKDGIKIWFNPLFSDLALHGQNLSSFDVFEKVKLGRHGVIVLHYEIQI